jgi:hypothetical protein
MALHDKIHWTEEKVWKTWIQHNEEVTVKYWKEPDLIFKAFLAGHNTGK